MWILGWKRGVKLGWLLIMSRVNGDKPKKLRFLAKIPILGEYSIFWLFHKIKSAWPYLSDNLAIRFLSLLDSKSDGDFFGWNNLEPGWHFENVWFIFFDILELISRRGSEYIRLRVKRGAFSRNNIIMNQSKYRIFQDLPQIQIRRSRTQLLITKICIFVSKNVIFVQKCSTSI
jgi:hypothetical protein